MKLSDVLKSCNLTLDDLQNIDTGDLEAIIEAVYGFGPASDTALDLIYDYLG